MTPPRCSPFWKRWNNTCAPDYDAEDGDDIIELTPELILEDIAALKPVLQQAITDGDKVHLRMLS